MRSDKKLGGHPAETVGGARHEDACHSGILLLSHFGKRSRQRKATACQRRSQVSAAGRPPDHRAKQGWRPLRRRPTSRPPTVSRSCNVWQSSNERRSITLKLAGDPIIFGSNLFLAVDPLQATHRKMTTGDVLEMVDERVVHRGAAQGADDGEGLRGNFLRGH
jgi:hypothetical protein